MWILAKIGAIASRLYEWVASIVATLLIGSMVVPVGIGLVFFVFEFLPTVPSKDPAEEAELDAEFALAELSPEYRACFDLAAAATRQNDDYEDVKNCQRVVDDKLAIAHAVRAAHFSFAMQRRAILTKD